MSHAYPTFLPHTHTHTQKKEVKVVDKFFIFPYSFFIPLLFSSPFHRHSRFTEVAIHSGEPCTFLRVTFVTRAHAHVQEKKTIFVEEYYRFFFRSTTSRCEFIKRVRKDGNLKLLACERITKFSLSVFHGHWFLLSLLVYRQC